MTPPPAALTAWIFINNYTAKNNKKPFEQTQFLERKRAKVSVVNLPQQIQTSSSLGEVSVLLGFTKVHTT